MHCKSFRISDRAWSQRFLLAIVALRRLKVDVDGLLEGVEHLLLDDGLARLVEVHVDLVDAVAERLTLRNFRRCELDRGGLVNDRSEGVAVDGGDSRVAVLLNAHDVVEQCPIHVREEEGGRAGEERRWMMKLLQRAVVWQNGIPSPTTPWAMGQREPSTNVLANEEKTRMCCQAV